MLNISPTKLNEKVDLSRFDAVQKVFHRRHYKYFNRFLLAFAIITLIVLFLPWTQNITSSGFLTTLNPDQRPQTIQSPIPGRLEKWYVREGDFVSNKVCSANSIVPVYNSFSAVKTETRSLKTSL